MDIFDSLLTLENSFYDDGYRDGTRDGIRAGTREGGQFGLETGFARFINIGIIRGRCEVWEKSKQVERLNELVYSVKTENNVNDVAEYEDALKKARVRAKIIAKSMKDLSVDLEDDVVRVLEEEIL